MTFLPDPFQTPERRALAASVNGFMAEHVAPNMPEWEEQGELPLWLHAEAAKVGLLGIGYPENVGGSGGDAIDLAIVLEETLRAGGSGGVMAALFTHGIATPHIVDEAQRRLDRGDRAGADYLLDHFVRPVLAGQALSALAVTEPDGGSDVAHLRTRATRHDGELTISGAKTYITSGARADHVVVAVRTGGPGAAGVSLAVVERGMPGFSVTRRLDKMGWRCSDTAELAFVDVRVPEANLLGAEEGFASLARHFVTERLTLAITGYATAQRCLDLTLRWCRERETFGRPLITRQVVRHTLVEMHRRTDVARRYSREVAVRHAAGEEVTALAILAKQTAVEACEYVVDRAVQLHGGAGYMRDSEVERHYRDARILGIGGGATEVMTDLAARLLL
ncbi:MAG: acyl-CoA dehydrogenase family protein [Candidatus Nanopelagicales bacterium]|nr:acyl-CoA dehydrogenase family protein [Candidatus Nanopelagicales bacterium]MDZ4250579.1 acyl-CoA dehydrogenase family protein [Candidatus Nanopelagicales bacterium]